MLMLTLALFLTASGPEKPAPISPDVFAPVSLYQGSWQATPSMSGTGVDTISNQCLKFTEYFACQQTVNGHVGALVVYVYGGTAGHYSTQAILPKGNATGRGDLLIEGERWTFSGKDTQNGKTTYFRTINDWRGNDSIHFEVSHSSDGNTWVVDHKGDETRMAAK